MNENDKSKFIDAGLFIFVMWSAYIGATIISAIFNIYLLSNLDQSWKLFLIGTSLVLEFSKAVVLLRRNTYQSIAIYLKKDTGHIVKKARMYFAYYLLFACLSLVASLGFSLKKTYSAETVANSGVSLAQIEADAIQSTIDTVTDAKNKYETALAKYTSIQDNADANIKAAKDAERKAEDALDKLAQEIAAQNEIQLSQARRTQAYQSSTQRTAYLRAVEDRKDLESGGALKRALAAKDTTKEEYDQIVAINGNLVELNVRLGEAKTKIQQAQAEQDKLEGSNIIFVLIARTFGIEQYTSQLKFCILFFVSLLIELTLFQTSPDIHVTGRLLYYFRNDLPQNIDPKKFVEDIKKKNKAFEEYEDNKITKKAEDRTKEIEKELSSKIKELTDKNIELEKENEALIEAEPKLSKIKELDDEIEKARRSLAVLTLSNSEILEFNSTKKELEQRIDNLTQQLETEKNKPAEEKIVYVDKIVEKVVFKEKEPERTEEGVEENEGTTGTPVILGQRTSEGTYTENREEVEVNEETPRVETETIDSENDSGDKEVQSGDGIDGEENPVEEKTETILNEEETPIENATPQVDNTSNIVGHHPTSKKYIFGRASDDLKLAFEKFIDLTIKNAGSFERSPEAASSMLQLPVKAKEMFMTALTTSKIDGTLCVEQSRRGGFISNFDNKTIKDFMFTEIE